MSHAGTKTSLTTFGPLHHDRGNNDGDNYDVELSHRGEVEYGHNDVEIGQRINQFIKTVDRHAPPPPPSQYLHPEIQIEDVELGRNDSQIEKGWKCLKSGWAGPKDFSIQISELPKGWRNRKLTWKVEIRLDSGAAELMSFNSASENFEASASGSQDGENIAFFNSDERDMCIHCFSYKTSSLKYIRTVLYGHRKVVKAVAFNDERHPDKPRLASVGYTMKDNSNKTLHNSNKTLTFLGRFLNTRTLFPMFVDEEVECIGEIIIWDEDLHQPDNKIYVKIAEEVHEELRQRIDEELFSICWSPSCVGNPESAVACGGKRCVFVYDSRTGKQLCKPKEMSWDEGDTANVISWSPAWPSQASESDNYSYIAVATLHKANIIHIWQVQVDRKRIRVRKLGADEFDSDPSGEHGKKVVDLIWEMTSESLLLLALYEDGDARLWRKSSATSAPPDGSRQETTKSKWEPIVDWPQRLQADEKALPFYNKLQLWTKIR